MRYDRRRGTAALVALATGCLIALSGCAVGARDAGHSAKHPLSAVAPVGATPAPSSSAATPAAAKPPAPTPPPDPCAGNAAAQLVLVSISEQHAWYCAGPHSAYDTPVTTGMSGSYTETPVGQFRIQAKDTGVTLRPTTGGAYAVKYWIPFEAPLYGFHDASWQDFPFGSQQYQTAGSHGCVHLPLAAIEYLYRWANVGTPVDIRA